MSASTGTAQIHPLVGKFPVLSLRFQTKNLRNLAKNPIVVLLSSVLYLAVTAPCLCASSPSGSAANVPAPNRIGLRSYSGATIQTSVRSAGMTQAEVCEARNPVDLVRRNRGVAPRPESSDRLKASGADSLGSAFGVGGEAVYGPASGAQLPTAIASDGTDYLVVWNDLRDGSWDIYGARVAMDRSLLDSSGIAISIAAKDQGHASVAFDGTSYFVVWEDARNGRYEIYGARVAADGRVLDPSGIRIATAAVGLRNPDIAFDGTNYLVVWQDSICGSYDVYGLRIGRDGNVLDSVRTPISIATFDQINPRVAFDGANYLVVWEDLRHGSHDVYGARVGTEGDVIDSSGIAIATATGDQAGPAIASGGSNYFVVWRDSRAGFDEIYGARVATDGSVLDSTGIPISRGPYEPEDPKVSFDGTNYLVVWHDWRAGVGVYAVRVSTQGSVIDTSVINVSPASHGGWSVAVSFNGTDYLVAWKGGGPYNVCGVRVGVEGTVLDSLPTNFAMSACDQMASAVAFAGTNYLVVWHELRDRGYDIYGARVAPDGRVPDSRGIPICTLAADQEHPAVASDGDNFLVVWQDSRVESYGRPHTIYGARVAQDGTVLDPSSIMISTASAYQEFPSVAFDGTHYLVVWQRNGDIYGGRVTTGGVVLDPAGIPISTAPNTQEHPSLAFDGINYLVVWQDIRGGYRNDVYGARVGVDGHAVDSTGIAISTAVWHQAYPDVAFDGSNYFVVWHDQRSGSSFDIYGARVGTDGSVLDPDGIPVSTAPDDQAQPAVAYDGSCYLVAWKGHRNGFFDVEAVRVSKDGAVLDPSGFTISSADQNQLAPSLSLGPSRQMLVVYPSFTPQVYGCYHIWGNLFGDCASVPGLPDNPEEPILCQILPNPFVTSTTLRFYLPREKRISVEVYDAEGRVVRKVAEGVSGPGMHRIIWDGRSGNETEVAPGIYFCRMEAGEYRVTKKVVRLK